MAKLKQTEAEHGGRAEGGRQMTAREYVEQARGMRARLEALEERRSHYEDLATNATAHYRAGPGGGTRRVSSVEEYAVKLADLSRDMAARAEIYAEALRQIEAAIDAVSVPIYRDVLKYRYLNGWKWERIAEALHYTRQGVGHIHGRALQCVRVPRDAEPVEEAVKRALKAKGAGKV